MTKLSDLKVGNLYRVIFEYKKNGKIEYGEAILYQTESSDPLNPFITVPSFTVIMYLEQTYIKDFGNLIVCLYENKRYGIVPFDNNEIEDYKCYLEEIK